MRFGARARNLAPQVQQACLPMPPSPAGEIWALTSVAVIHYLPPLQSSRMVSITFSGHQKVSFGRDERSMQYLEDRGRCAVGRIFARWQI